MNQKLKPTKPIKTEQVKIDDQDEITKERYKMMVSDITKLGLKYQKVLMVNLSFNAKGQVELTYFGASPQIESRAQFLATQIADLVPSMMASYDIPQVDIQDEQAQS